MTPQTLPLWGLGAPVGRASQVGLAPMARKAWGDRVNVELIRKGAKLTLSALLERASVKPAAVGPAPAAGK